MITITFYEDELRTILIGRLIFQRNSNFFKFFGTFFNYNDLYKTTRHKKRFDIVKT